MAAEPFFTTPGMTAIWSARAHVVGMLAFEAALASALAGAGLVPTAAAEAIRAACRVELFDVEALYREAVADGTLAIPLVRRLTALVDGDGARHVHRGATSQDAIDSATVLQVRAGLDLLEADLLGIGQDCAALAARHRADVMAGRTLLQQALPITFGLKAARWLAMVARQIEALRALRPRVLVVQFGGAAGTLAALGRHGPRVVDLVAADLDLAVPDLPWHAERDRVAALAGALGVLAAAAAKISGDIILLAQTEVGEVVEGGGASGKGGSSTLPQKRNPIDAVEAVAAARLAIGQVPILLVATAGEHERAAGGWQAEWAALPALFGYTAGALAHLRAALEGLEVRPERMRANLGAAGGTLIAESLASALTPALGRSEAQRLVTRLATSAQPLAAAAADDSRVRAVLTPDQIDRALDPRSYLGSADLFVDRALDAWQRLDPAPR